jgi:hypothetical protein
MSNEPKVLLIDKANGKILRELHTALEYHRASFQEIGPGRVIISVTAVVDFEKHTLDGHTIADIAATNGRIWKAPAA